VAKPDHITLGDGTIIPILFEDRSVLAIDKPAGWLVAPESWVRTSRNLTLAIQSSLNAGDFWATARNLRFLRHVHRLDAETSGVLLLAKSMGALRALGELFEDRRVEKVYLAVVRGQPREREWTCRRRLADHPAARGRVVAVDQGGEDAETHFRVLHQGEGRALVEARPVTGRTHQIRVHLAESGCPVLGDPLYGGEFSKSNTELALRAVRLTYRDPFQRRPVTIVAPTRDFLRTHGLASVSHSNGPVRAAAESQPQPSGKPVPGRSHPSTPRRGPG
jgi:RluA family pseudouridine synthase